MSVNDNPMLKAVLGEMREARKKQAKGVLKDLLGKRQKAVEVVEGIDAEIAEVLRDAGADLTADPVEATPT